MTWEIAFVVVGLVWALVFLIAILNSHSKERDLKVSNLESQVAIIEKEISWLSVCYKNIIKDKS